MADEFMTPKERWQAVLERKTPDRIPMDYWATPEATQKLARFLGCQRSSSHQIEPSLSPWGGWASGGGWKTGGAWTETEQVLFEHLHIDAVVAVQPLYKGPAMPEKTDIFGCRFRDMDYGYGVYSECIHFPLAEFQSVGEIGRKYRWPNLDWFDYSKIPDQIKGKERFPVSAGGSEPFLLYQYLRGREQAFIDLVEFPEIAHYCIDQLFDLAYENTRRILEQIPNKALLSYIAEDFGTQQHLIMSPKTIREFLLPGMKRMIELVHQAGAYVFFHSDGAVRDILPEMIAAGIDILNPVQWRCNGMDREALKHDFGDQIIFHGGVDNQYTLAFGDVGQVTEEVKENIRLLGANGGYILAPCHNLQAVSQAESIAAMYEAGLIYGS